MSTINYIVDIFGMIRLNKCLHSCFLSYLCPIRLALILTTYNTVFGGGFGTPEGFSLLFAIDWFIDRCATMLNVTGKLYNTNYT